MQGQRDQREKTAFVSQENENFATPGFTAVRPRPSSPRAMPSIARTADCHAPTVNCIGKLRSSQPPNK
jgi:hypothetical protein